MKLIIGLGNPGKNYAGTRHNLGFETIDTIQKKWDCSPFTCDKKFNAEISAGNLKLENKKLKFLLIKPQTFMNNSGVVVKSILDFYKLKPNDIIVVHDDLDIAFGKHKLAVNSSSAGHNGVQSIIDQLGTQKFSRIRIGIGKETENIETYRIKSADFVLDKFSKKENDEIKKISEDILSKISEILQEDF